MENYFYEAFEGLTRLAPGSERSTKKAISLVNIPREKELKILDIGCGTGIHTVLLAEAFPNAQITAVDMNEQYLDMLKKQLHTKRFEDRVHILNTSMFEMDFLTETFDIIWAEGSIYIAGFQEGLKKWKTFLKQDGTLICSEISWLHANPSPECKEFWGQAYPEINSIPAKMNQIEELKYVYDFSFVLPKENWIEEYYNPLERNLTDMEKRHVDNPDALEVIELIRQEIRLYHENVNDYSYVFYGMKKS